MLPHRSSVFACEHCRTRRRRCDRNRPKCSSCSSQEVECVYPPASDPQPSLLIQELASIRERLESIAPLMKPPPSSPTTFRDDTLVAPCHSPPHIPPLTIKSPLLMQVIGLRPDLSSFFYRLETGPACILDSPGDFRDLTLSEATLNLVLTRFEQRVHQWYPILHSGFTGDFFNAVSSGFPPSTMTCLSLLVILIACPGDELRQPIHFEAALSMFPIVFQESSVTSVQCLILFSIYFSSRIQPRQAYDYIQAASMRIRPHLRRYSLRNHESPCLPGRYLASYVYYSRLTYHRDTSADQSSNWDLVLRLYWAIYMIESETSMHLNLPGIGRRKDGADSPVPLPANDGIWKFSPHAHSPIPSPSTPSPQSPETDMFGRSTQLRFYFLLEMQLQLQLIKSISAGIEETGTMSPAGSQLEKTLDMTQLCMLPLSAVPDSPHHQQDALVRAKYHAYEITIYWPMIYHIIGDGFADSELLPYGPLFFESVASFLSAANIALRLCPLKTWSLCASIYVMSMVAVKAMEIPCLRRLSQPAFWKCLKISVGCLEAPAQLSPSIQYMRETLAFRLEKANIL